MGALKSRFVTSLPAYGDFEGRGLPQIALAGRSNVGKSSLINTLSGEKRLARISATPGKTSLINIYLADERFHLVDLPGYGYARVSKAEKERWGRMVQGYFAQTASLKAVVHLVDIRLAPSADDVAMNLFLRSSGFPFVTVATKADKLSRAARGSRLLAISRALAVQPWELLAFSALSGDGTEALMRSLSGFLRG